jgi:hypothetical protein
LIENGFLHVAANRDDLAAGYKILTRKSSKNGEIYAQLLPLVIFMRHGQAF